MVSYDNFQLKLIDFGCGTNLKKSDYTEFAGTPEFYPELGLGQGHSKLWGMGKTWGNMESIELKYNPNSDVYFDVS